MKTNHDCWFAQWTAAAREALGHGRDGRPGPAPAGAFDAVFEAVTPLCEGRDAVGVGAGAGGAGRWEDLRADGDRLSLSKPFRIVEHGTGGTAVVAEVFGRFHQDARLCGGCLFVRAADWQAFVVVDDDRVHVLLRSDSGDGLYRVSLPHRVVLNPRCGGMSGTIDGGREGPIQLDYEPRRWRPPRWIRVGREGTDSHCLIDLRETVPFRETASLLGGIVRGHRPVRDLFGGRAIFLGDLADTLLDPDDRRVLLCLAMVLRTMVWKSESSG